MVIGFIRVRWIHSCVPLGSLVRWVNSGVPCGSLGLVGFIRVRPRGLWIRFLVVVRFIRFLRVRPVCCRVLRFVWVRTGGRWVHSGEPLGSFSSFGFVEVIRVRPGNRCVHSGLLG